MRRVFEGGVGCIRGGIVERSMDIFCRDALEVGRDDCGELSAEDMVKWRRSGHSGAMWCGVVFSQRLQSC